MSSENCFSMPLHHRRKLSDFLSQQVFILQTKVEFGISMTIDNGTSESFSSGCEGRIQISSVRQRRGSLVGISLFFTFPDVKFFFCDESEQRNRWKMEKRSVEIGSRVNHGCDADCECLNSRSAVNWEFPA